MAYLITTKENVENLIFFTRIELEMYILGIASGNLTWPMAGSVVVRISKQRAS